MCVYVCQSMQQNTAAGDLIDMSGKLGSWIDVMMRVVETSRTEVWSKYLSGD